MYIFNNFTEQFVAQLWIIQSELQLTPSIIDERVIFRLGPILNELWILSICLFMYISCD